jgi:hypothetical protein
MESPAEIYEGLRGQALGLASAGVEGIPSEALLLAVLMDWAIDDAVVTLVGVADGSTSLYFSNGGGVIGAGRHAQVAEATRHFLEVAVSAPDAFAQVDDVRLPEPGEVQFVLVTRAGLARAGATEAELRESHPLAPLYTVAQDVVTQVRLAEQAAR